MQEHPVPQNITAYEFHLIGSMTIKQFLILLAGGGIGLFFFSTNLPGIIKWPLVTIGVLAGIAMAFVPYEERTLDQWFINFIRAIYRPTKYYWRRTPHVPEFFTYTSSSSSQMLYQPDRSPMRRSQVDQYLSSLNGPLAEQEKDALDLFQDNSNIMALFNTVDAASNVAPSRNEVTRPSLTPRSRALGGSHIVYTQAQTQTVAQTEYTNTTPAYESPQAAILSIERDEEAPLAAPASHEAQVAKVSLISVDPSQVAETAPQEVAAPPTEVADSSYMPAQQLAPATTGASPVVFNRNLPFPSLPSLPNLLIGMVHDRSKSIVPNAIVEIIDEAGNTVRAMKTNSLGQFYISSPLKAGTYTLQTEKDELIFPTYTLEVKDTVLDPIDIQANG